MARLQRSYPGQSTGLHNAKIITPAANLSPLPTIKTYGFAAMQRSIQSDRRRPLSTKLRPPQVVSAAPGLSPLPLIKKAPFAVPRAVQSSLRRPLSTRIRPPTVINTAPAIFLPTLGQFYHQAVNKSYKQAQRVPDSTGYLNPVRVIGATPNLFLPTRARTLDKSKHTNRANSTLLRNKLVVAPPVIFLPTLGYFGKIALLRSYRQAQRVPDSTALLNAKGISPTPNLFLPTANVHLQAVNRSTQSRRPQSTRLSQIPYVYFPVASIPAKLQIYLN